MISKLINNTLYRDNVRTDLCQASLLCHDMCVDCPLDTDETFLTLLKSFTEEERKTINKLFGAS